MPTLFGQSPVRVAWPIHAQYSLIYFAINSKLAHVGCRFSSTLLFDLKSNRQKKTYFNLITAQVSSTCYCKIAGIISIGRDISVSIIWLTCHGELLCIA